jgi:hypothetical protein
MIVEKVLLEFYHAIHSYIEQFKNSEGFIQYYQPILNSLALLLDPQLCQKKEER